MLRHRVGELLNDRLSDREREIVRLRFGLDDGHRCTLSEIAGVFHVTRERIRQIEKRALAKLQDTIRASELVGYIES